MIQRGKKNWNKGGKNTNLTKIYLERMLEILEKMLEIKFQKMLEKMLKIL